MLPETFFLNAGIMGILNGEVTYLHRLVDAIAFRVLPVEETATAGLVAFGLLESVEKANAVQGTHHGQ
jgi:lipopolysaccharide transport system ATP-binding protein